MTRDTERHIAKLEKTAQALKEASLAGPYANRLRLAWDLEAAAKRARESEKLLKRAEKMIEQDRQQLQQLRQEQEQEQEQLAAEYAQESVNA